jgi:DNA-binding NarL/FixJ family response regulator
MLPVCPDNHANGPGGQMPPGDVPRGRLNLLLSCAGWRTDSWADALPPLLEPLGVNSLRARTAREAERTIRSYRIHIAVVDLGLPLDGDGSGSPRPVFPAVAAPHEEAGPRILELLRRLESPPPTVVVKGPRTVREETRDMAAALRCGAFAVVDRAGASVEQMLDVLRRCLRRYYHDRWPD